MLVSIVFSACASRIKNQQVTAPPAGMTPVEISQISANAEQSMAVKDYLKAIQLYQSVVKSNPSVASAWFRLGIAYLRVDQLKQAQEAFEEALRADPTMDKTYANLALTHLLEFRVVAQKALQSEQISEPNRAALRSLIADVDRTLNMSAPTPVSLDK